MLNSFEKLTQKPHAAIQFPLRIRLYKFTSNADAQSQRAVAHTARSGQSGLYVVTKMDASLALLEVGI